MPGEQSEGKRGKRDDNQVEAYFFCDGVWCGGRMIVQHESE